jgi:tRNA (uracil-5-)-methyltransferase TRM9
MNTGYASIAKSFSDTRPKPWDWIIKFYTELSEQVPDAHILDHGCGSGRNMVNIELDTINAMNVNITMTNFKFTGIDNCIEFITIAQSKNHNAILGDMCNMVQFHNNTFDAIVSIASFHHLSDVNKRIQALNELYRVMKPGARCLMSVWSILQPEKSKNYNKFVYGDNIVPWKNKQGHIISNRYYYIFNDNELENLICSCGFSIKSVKWIYGNTVIEFIKPS